MRVLLAPEGTRGDVQPLAVLGEALAAQGCEVVACAPRDAGALVEAHGLRFEPLETDVRAFLEARARTVAAGGWRVQRSALAYFRQALARQFDGLARVARGSDLVLGAGVQLGAPSVAESLGIPYRFVAYCPVLFPSREHPPFAVERDVRSPRANRLLWRLFLGACGALLRPALDAHRARLGLGPVADAYAYLRSPRPILAADPDLAPLPEDCPFPVDVVGCLQPPSRGRLPAKLESFLRTGPAPVYVGFGSMPDPEPAATTRRVVDAVRRAGLRALVHEGWARLGAGPLPEGVMPVGSVDHAALFPRVALVVHHGGAGTTAAAARAGVPQLVVPHLLDQFYWARRVEALGLGPPALPRRRLSSDRLAARLAATADNEVVAERAADLGRRIRARRPTETAVDLLLGSSAAHAGRAFDP